MGNVIQKVKLKSHSVSVWINKNAEKISTKYLLTLVIMWQYQFPMLEMNWYNNFIYKYYETLIFFAIELKSIFLSYYILKNQVNIFKQSRKNTKFNHYIIYFQPGPDPPVTLTFDPMTWSRRHWPRAAGGGVSVAPSGGEILNSSPLVAGWPTIRTQSRLVWWLAEGRRQNLPPTGAGMQSMLSLWYFATNLWFPLKL